VLAGANDPKLDSCSVDRILVVDVWHHIGSPRRVCARMASALRPGGQILIVDSRSIRVGSSKQHRLLPDAVIADLRAAGLDAALSTTKLPISTS